MSAASLAGGVTPDAPGDLLAIAVAAALEAGDLLASQEGRVAVAATKSSPTDVVTEMDGRAEELIRARILAARPNDAILGEEGGQIEGAADARVRWVVDPLDGTVNYLYGLHDWAVSIAAEVAWEEGEEGGELGRVDDGEAGRVGGGEVGRIIVAGAVYVPMRGELFTAVRGEGAWLESSRESGAPARADRDSPDPVASATAPGSAEGDSLASLVESGAPADAFDAVSDAVPNALVYASDLPLDVSSAPDVPAARGVPDPRGEPESESASESDIPEISIFGRVRLRCGPGVSLGQALVATGFGYTAERRKVQGEVLAALLPQIRDIRRNGAASVDLCAVAANRVDAFYERGLNYWDYAAGALVAAEAGAAVGDTRGGPPSTSMTVVAGPALFGPLRDTLAALDAERDD
jgi:fructose-1,6-bisphosphatase/inositol monophosphatase family enzyme